MIWSKRWAIYNHMATNASFENNSRLDLIHSFNLSHAATCSSLHEDDPHGVGEASTLLPASHHYHRIPRLQELALLADVDGTVNARVHVSHPVLWAVLCWGSGVS